MDTLIKVQFNPENFRRALNYLHDAHQQFTIRTLGTAIMSERTIKSEWFYGRIAVEFDGTIVEATKDDIEGFYGYCNVR